MPTRLRLEVNHEKKCMTKQELIIEQQLRVIEGFQATVAQALDRHRRLGESIEVMQDDEWFEVGVDVAIAFSEGTGSAFEFIGDENVDGWDFSHRFRPRGFQWG
jgi:hypothetical protein